MITLDLTEQEAESFKNWRKHQDQFEVLVEAGVFKTNTGKVLLHFRDTLVEQVQIDIVAWKKKV